MSVSLEQTLQKIIADSDLSNKSHSLCCLMFASDLCLSTAAPGLVSYVHKHVVHTSRRVADLHCLSTEVN